MTSYAIRFCQLLLLRKKKFLDQMLMTSHIIFVPRSIVGQS